MTADFVCIGVYFACEYIKFMGIMCRICGYLNLRSNVVFFCMFIWNVSVLCGLGCEINFYVYVNV